MAPLTIMALNLKTVQWNTEENKVSPRIFT